MNGCVPHWHLNGQIGFILWAFKILCLIVNLNIPSPETQAHKMVHKTQSGEFLKILLNSFNYNFYFMAIIALNENV
jgi:hypothetical protein